MKKKTKKKAAAKNTSGQVKKKKKKARRKRAKVIQKPKITASTKGGMRAGSGVNEAMKLIFRQRMDMMELRKATNNRQKKCNSYYDATDSALSLFSGMTQAIEDLEKEITSISVSYLKSHPLYWLFQKYYGLSDMLGLAMLGNIDIYRGDTVSKMWVPAGLGMEYKYRSTYKDLYYDGNKLIKTEGPETKEVFATSVQSALNAIPMKKTIQKGSNKILVRIERESIDTYRISNEPERQKKRKGQYPTFNNDLKMVVLGQVGQGFMKVCSNVKRELGLKDPKYLDLFQDFMRKHEPISKNKGHCVKRAARDTMKEFFKEFYVQARTLYGLPVRAPYSEAVMKKPPHGQRGQAAS